MSGADGPLPALEITASQWLLTVITVIVTTVKLHQTIILTTNT